MERYDLPAEKLASPEELGMLRVADETDEKNCSCNDAAITPNNLYRLLDYRKASTTYTAGTIVACPYHKEFLLKCTTGGTTSANYIDTTSVAKGGTITDGGVVWTVIASQIIDIAISGKVVTVTFIDGTQKTLTTQDTAPFTARATEIGGASATEPAVVVESYRNGNNWYRKYSDGWIEQGGILASSGGTVTLNKSFSDTNYSVFLSPVYNSDYNPDYVTYTASCSTTSFTINNPSQNSAKASRVMWYACGV